MIIKTITCHDVYNSGASLQAYALASYLHILGHEVEIIDYRPGYLSNHFPLLGVSNPEYDKPFVREAYQLLKLPGRIKERHSRRKQEFPDQCTSAGGRRRLWTDQLRIPILRRLLYQKLLRG